MTSSSSAMASGPPHPEAAEDQSAAIDEGHPEIEAAAGVEIADRCQRRHGKADHDEGIAEPEPGDAVEQHEIDRPERAQLPRAEMAENAAEDAEDDDHRHGVQEFQIEGAHARFRRIDGAE